MKLTKSKYNKLLESIGTTLQTARQNAVNAINIELVQANWLIGKYIIEYEQQGKERAEYGTELIVSLAKDLKLRFGKGFSRSNLQLMRQFYIKYPELGKLLKKPQIRQTVSGKLLSWSHYAELLTITDDLARSFYEKQAIKENWGFREMNMTCNATSGNFIIRM